MYSKLYRSIFDGSLYGQFESLTTFMAMLALADRHGEVDASPAKIAGCLGCELDFVLKGIEQLEAPDPYSRTPLEDGKRLIPLKDDAGNNRIFGWKIVNYEKYRSIRNEEERRAYKREWDRKNRSRDSNPTNSDRARPETTYTEAEAEADTKDQNKGRFAPPSVEQVKKYTTEKQLNVNPNSFVDFYESKGWMVGKNKMKDWKAAARNWGKRQTETKPDNGGHASFKTYKPEF